MQNSRPRCHLRHSPEFMAAYVGQRVPYPSVSSAGRSIRKGDLGSRPPLSPLCKDEVLNPKHWKGRSAPLRSSGRRGFAEVEKGRRETSSIGIMGQACCDLLCGGTRSQRQPEFALPQQQVQMGSYNYNYASSAGPAAGYPSRSSQYYAGVGPPVALPANPPPNQGWNGGVGQPQLAYYAGPTVPYGSPPRVSYQHASSPYQSGGAGDPAVAVAYFAPAVGGAPAHVSAVVRVATAQPIPAAPAKANSPVRSLK